MKVTLFASVGLAILLAGCGADQAQSPITPAADTPTFLYFYTDG